MFKDILKNKIFFFSVCFLLFGTITVFAGSIIVNESGIRIEADNYYSSSGAEGITSNISYKNIDNENYFLIVQNGLIVGTEQIISESNQSENESSFPSEGLLAYYKFDETSGTNAYDEFGNYSGRINGTTVGEVGLINYSYGFDGTDDYIDVNVLASALSGNSAFSYNIWINPDNLSSGSGVVGIIGSSNTNLIHFHFFSDGDIGSYLYGPNVNLVTTAENLILTGSWQMATLTYNGSTVKIYVNGTEVISANASRTIDSGSYLNIGKEYSDDRYFEGRMDEVGIWDRALNSTEVAALYNNGNGLTYSN